jgi:hypothetical protein
MESNIVALTKCVIVGLSVGLSGAVLCVLGSLFFYALRDLGIFILLFLIPVGALFSWRVSRKYLAQGTNRTRGAIAFGIRYFFLGAALGFVLTAYAEQIANHTFFGGAIGFTIGSLGGAFQGWLSSGKKRT